MQRTLHLVEIVPDVRCGLVQETPSADKVNQYGALCLRSIDALTDELEVLLITSRDTGRWVIPKGRPMRGKQPHQVARREAWEEAGVRGRVQKRPFGHYRYVKTIANDGALPCLVQVHLLNVSDLDPNFPESGQRALRWFSAVEAAASVKDLELARLLLALIEIDGATLQAGWSH